MTNLHLASLDAQLRARETYVQRGVNPPNWLHTGEIAKRLAITEAEVIEHLESLSKPKEPVA